VSIYLVLIIPYVINW